MTKKPEPFVPAHDFTGYPGGKKTEFRKGVETEPLPAEFVDLMRTKGHARKERKSAQALRKVAAPAIEAQQNQPGETE